MGVESSELRSLPSSIATDTITSTSGRQKEKWEWKYWYSSKVAMKVVQVVSKRTVSTVKRRNKVST